MMFTTTELARLTMDDFEGDEGCAFAIGALAGMLSVATVLEGAAAAALVLGKTEAAELVRGLAKTFKETVAEKLGEIQKPKFDS